MRLTDESCIVHLCIGYGRVQMTVSKLRSIFVHVLLF